jgi:hypothetical protein
MGTDRDRLSDRLDATAVRERLEEHVDPDAVRDRLEEHVDPDAVRDRVDAVEVDTVRNRVEEGLDPEAVRSSLDDVYARYFLPPSVTGEVESGPDEAPGTEAEPFDFGAWLEEGRGSGPTEPPAEPRVVAEAVTPTVDPEADYGSFDFEAWLTEGEEFEPVELLEPEAEEPAGDLSVEPEPTEGQRLRRPTFGIHPAKAATYGLFLAVVTLVALSVAGHLPALGPTGF